MPDTNGSVGEDLWGSPFETPPKKTAPVRVLEDQANALSKRTDGKVTGEVTESVDTANGTLWIGLYAVVPSRNPYRFKIVTISHPLAADPNNPSPITAHSACLEGESDKLQSMHDLTPWLAKQLSSNEMHNIISGLMVFAQNRVAS